MRVRQRAFGRAAAFSFTSHPSSASNSLSGGPLHAVVSVRELPLCARL